MTYIFLSLDVFGYYSGLCRVQTGFQRSWFQD